MPSLLNVPLNNSSLIHEVNTTLNDLDCFFPHVSHSIGPEQGGGRVGPEEIGMEMGGHRHPPRWQAPHDSVIVIA